MYRHLTCPICETVVEVEVPEVIGPDGVERHVLPVHPPTLPVNACLALRVEVAIGPGVRTTRAQLDAARPSIPPRLDARRGRP